MADACLELPLLGADAEKLAVRELVCLAPDDWTSVESVGLAEVPLLWEAVQLVSAALGKPAAVPSAAQSCAVREAVDEVVKPGQRGVGPVPKYQGPDLVPAKPEQSQPEVKVRELPEEQRAKRSPAAQPM